MKKTIKKLVCLALALTVVLSFAGCAKINYVTNGTITAIKDVNSGKWKEANGNATEQEAEPDVAKIDEFKPGTYAGLEIASVEDLVNLYVEAFNNTKSRKAMFKDVDSGNNIELYDFLGTEKLEVMNILIEGKENSVINNLVPSIAGGAFKPSTWGLGPSCSVEPAHDKTDEFDFSQSMLTAEDVLAANIVDNGDGTVTVKIQPKGGDMSQKGKDSQGRFFMVLGDVAGEVGKISAISWAEGTAAENVKVRYQGGVGTVKIDVATKDIVEADYEMDCKVYVNHANIAVIKDKSASLDIVYSQHFPADAEYLKEQKGFVRVG